MYRFFINQEQAGDGFIRIGGQDAHHMKNVLRMRVGEAVEIVDDESLLYRCRISRIEDESLCLEIEEVLPSANELPCEITLYMGLAKGDRMELIAQKAVELGVARIVPVAMERSVVRLNAQKAERKRERWQAIADAAAKQSKRGLMPQVGQVLSFDEALLEARGMDHLLVPYECAEGIGAAREAVALIRPGESVALFIGPEGGFGLQEIEAAKAAGGKIMTLGRRILRAETAAIAALAILMFAVEG